MSDKHRIATVKQRDDEDRAYTFSVSNVTSAPASPSCSALDITDPDSVSDVSGTVLDGTASVSSTDITTQRISGLTEGQKYRLITTFTDGGQQTFSYYFDIVCTGDSD